MSSSLFYKIVLMCVFVILFSSINTVHSKTLPLEAFASLPDVSNVLLSPDGKKVLSLVKLDTRDKKGTAIALHDIATGKKSYLAYAKNSDYRIEWVRWGNNTKILVSAIFATKRDGVPVSETRLLIADVNSKKMRNAIPRKVRKRFYYVPQFQDQIIDMLPDDPEHVLLEVDGFKGGEKSVYKVSLTKSRMTRVQAARANINSWTTDRQSNVRIGLYWKDTQYKLIHRFPGEKKWRTLWEFEAFSGDHIWPLGFDENPDYLYVRALHNGFDAIFKVNLRDKALTKTRVYSENQDVHGNLIYSSLAKKVIGVSSSVSGGYTFFDKKYQAIQRGINKALPDAENYFYSMSEDERRYVVLSTSDTDPGVYLIGDRDTQTLSTIAYRYSRLDPKALVDQQHIKYKARDGLEISGYLSLPKTLTGPSAKAPAIIFPHGGPISHDGRGFDYWSQFFVNRGYAVLKMNFRGSSGYGFDFMKAGLKNWGLAMQDDIEDGARWLINTGKVDPERLCIVGASYGGYAALMGSVKTPDLYKCAVSFAGVTDVAMMMRKSRQYSNKEIVEKQIGSNMKSLKQRSPVNHIDKITIPVLLIHGKKDRSVNVKHSQKMYKRLLKAGKDVEYIELEKGSHFLSKNEHRLTTFRAMESFLNKHLTLSR